VHEGSKVDDGRRSKRISAGRVCGSWTILAIAALAKAAFLGWFGWLSLSLVAVSWALAGMAHVPPPPPRTTAQILVGAAELGAVFGVFAGVIGAATAAAQRLVLGRPSGAAVFWDPLQGWVARTAAAAAVATFAWLFVAAVWNNVEGLPSGAGLLAQLIAGSTVELGAIAVVQRRLLARARPRTATVPA
jgi:hypothetical protein